MVASVNRLKFKLKNILIRFCSTNLILFYLVSSSLYSGSLSSLENSNEPNIDSLNTSNHSAVISRSIADKNISNASLNNSTAVNLRDNEISEKNNKKDRAALILDFWFGQLNKDDDFPAEKVAIWRNQNGDTTRFIQANFSQDILKAQRGELNEWRHTPTGRLALILLLHQFPRCIYCNTDKRQAFMYDAMAKGLVLEGVKQKQDQQLQPFMRAFFYLPLEHTEDADIQKLSVQLYQQLVNSVAPSMRSHMQSFLNYALLHQKQIMRFGRFPHRNEILGRESTPEELIFLHQWQSF